MVIVTVKLTEKEIVICRLLLLNLTSKQISQKMDITVQSVNNYRASVRKKMELKSGENLKRPTIYLGMAVKSYTKTKDFKAIKIN